MVSFVVPGRPVPAVRMTQRGKYTKAQAKRYMQYKDKVGWAAKRAGIRQLRGKVRIWITIYLAGGLDGDWDNYAKSICDGLNSIAYRDDRDIVDAHVVKVLGVASTDERAEIKIWQIREDTGVSSDDQVQALPQL